MGGGAVKPRCIATVPNAKGRPAKCGKPAHGPFCADHDAMFAMVADRAPAKVVQR